MTTKKDREATIMRFDYTQAEKYNNLVTTMIQDANHEVHDGLAEFEARLA